ncbi:MAG: cellulase family glycosylhydrolase [Ignavibacteriales bacterium]|nr:cellulase family glycosylhydrolase [Ignavibacteriales bacterium]
MKTSVLKTIILVLMLGSLCYSQGFLKVSGKNILDKDGKEIILRGMGIGGWMLPEGYMLQMSAFANAPWEIKKKIVEIVGQQKADSFWTAYRKNFVQRKDIERLAQLGFNSVRLAMHWEFYLNGDGSWRVDGFELTDSLLRQCADNNIYLILDLHAAPGGQSANNISDYNPAFLSLWESNENKLATVKLWKKLAERYKDEPWIGGYDILNEPAWDLPPTNKPLRDLSVMITDSIRSVDKNHIVFVEGNWYATDFNGMTPAWDDNMVWSFHKYWNSNDIGAINYLLTLRNTTNRPLWLGESGENSNTWFTDCISLMESNKIGWAWWTLKKFGTINGPFNVPPNAEYDYLIRYWKGQVSKPTVEYAMKGLMGMAEGLKLEKCVYNSGVIDAMFRQVNDATTKPYAPNVIPGKIFLVNYDYGKNGIAYKDIISANTDNKSTWNNGWAYRNDGVDIEQCSDAVTNGFNVGWIETGEFLLYTVDVQQDGKYAISLRVAANDAGGYVGMSWDGKDQLVVPLTKTGGWQTWQTQKLGDVDLAAGKHTVRLNLYFGGFNLNYLDCVYAGPMSAGSTDAIPAEFSLGQNFPNPFNPETTIKYAVPVSGFVSLTVRDVLGKEVSTPVHEVKSPGDYSVRFAAGTLPSGIYFYTLRAGNFVSTKKLMLLK